MVLLAVSESNTLTRTRMSRWQHDQLSLHKSRYQEHANFAGVKHLTLKGLDPRINPDTPLRIFKDAMKVLASLGRGLQFGVLEIRRTKCIQSSETRDWSKNLRHNHKA